MKKLLTTLIIVTVSFSALAQKTKKDRKEQKRQKIDALVKQEEEGVIVYKKHFVLGVKLINDGYGIFFEKGIAKSIKKATLFQLEIAERKHQKEIKLGSLFSSASPVIYGKLNYFYPVKLGVQQQFLLGNKSNKNGVSITANIGAGISLGLLRPYEIEVDKDGKREYIYYDSPDSVLFVSTMNAGTANGPTISNGWKDLKFTPGLYIKPAFRFDYGRYNEMVTAIEVGLNAEYYSKKIPQMLYTKEKQFFFGAYMALTFGKRK